MTAFWIVTTIAAVIFLLIFADILRTPKRDEQKTEEPLTAEELVSAAIELDAIHHRLDIAWCHHELRGEANRLRRELDAELRQIDALEAGKSEE